MGGYKPMLKRVRYRILGKGTGNKVTDITLCLQCVLGCMYRGCCARIAHCDIHGPCQQKQSILPTLGAIYVQFRKWNSKNIKPLHNVLSMSGLAEAIWHWSGRLLIKTTPLLREVRGVCSLWKIFEHWLSEIGSGSLNQLLHGLQKSRSYVIMSV